MGPHLTFTAKLKINWNEVSPFPWTGTNFVQTCLKTLRSLSWHVFKLMSKSGPALSSWPTWVIFDDWIRLILDCNFKSSIWDRRQKVSIWAVTQKTSKVNGKSSLNNGLITTSAHKMMAFWVGTFLSINKLIDRWCSSQWICEVSTDTTPTIFRAPNGRQL